MAVFFQKRLPLSPGARPLCAWSRGGGGDLLLASASAAGGGGGAVVVYSDEGAPIAAPVAAGAPTALAWHPRQRLLAIGWSDGAVTLWSPKEPSAPREDRTAHSESVTALAWSPDGVRLVSGDAQGALCVWKADPRGRPVVIVQYQTAQALAKAQALEGGPQPSPGKVSHIVFNTSEEMAPSSEAKEKALLPVMSAPFHYVICAPRADERSVVSTADDQGNLTAAFQVEGEVAKALFYRERNGLVLVTKEAVLHVNVLHGGAFKPKLTSKLNMSAESTELFVTWAGPHMLASAGNGDSLVRMLDLADEDNFALPLLEADGRASNDRVACLAFNDVGGHLGAGTNTGRVAMWTNSAFSERKAAVAENGEFKDSEDQWYRGDLIELANAQGQQRVERLHWAPTNRGRVLAAATSSGITVLRKAVLQRRVSQGLQLVQIAANHLHVSSAVDETAAGFIKTDLQIVGVDASQDKVWEWHGRSGEMVASFACPTAAMGIHMDSIYRAAGHGVQICNLQGTVESTLTFEEAHGAVEQLETNGEYLAAVTAGGVLKMWRLGGREPQPHGPVTGRMIEVAGASAGAASSVRVNCNGSCVSVIVQSLGEETSPMLLVYDVESDLWVRHSCAPYDPVGHAWDLSEPKLVAVECAGGHGEVTHDAGEVRTLFLSPGDGLFLQELVPLSSELTGLVGLAVPHVSLSRRLVGAVDEAYVAKKVMRDFTGMEYVDESTGKALLDFSYNMALGNMDEAFKSVRLIRNPTVWENMAKMCVKTKRIDVVEHCLANMGHVRGARAIRAAGEYPEVEARMGLVAIQLGMFDDAEQLFTECERYDLLNDMYQAQGKWGAAIHIATEKDRIHLRNTHFKHGRHLESVGDVAGAIKAYEESGTHRAEVPRMLHGLGRTAELEQYVREGGDKGLSKWWARFCESTGAYDKAMECYEAASDALSLVRMYCAQGDFAKAAELVSSTDNSAAAFHLARQYEARVGEYRGTAEAGRMAQDAIKCYASAGRHGQALRMAMRFELDSEVMAMAMQAPPAQVGEAAAYFDAREMYDKSVLVHQRCGNLSRALDLCFRGQLFDSLRLIVDNLATGADAAGGGAASADAELLARCGDFFMQHRQYDKAMHMFVISGRYQQALDLCVQHNIALTEELADKVTPPKSEGEDPGAAERRREVLLEVANICAEQGSYHLASKKFVQAGDKLTAMKVLMRSGDTEKICFFAGVSRQREIYLLAGNYLQSLDWHSNPDIMKNIIQFYVKAKAMDSLSAFYESCAQIEIDEYRDYKKALGALGEAVKYTNKIRGPDREERLAQLAHKQRLMEAFVEAQASPAAAIGICENILEHLPAHVPDHEQPLRAGDVYNLMVESHVGHGDTAAAAQTIERMRERIGAIEPYIDRVLLEQVLGHSAPDSPVGGHDEPFVEEEVEEVDEAM
eukprot:PRCOL_00002319-RA